MLDIVDLRKNKTTTDKPQIIDLSKQKKTSSTDEFDKDDQNPNLAEQEELGQKVVLYGSYILASACIILSLVSYQYFFVPRETKKYISQTEPDFKQIENSLQTLKSNIIQNFHDDLAVTDKYANSNQQKILDENEIIINDLKSKTVKVKEAIPQVWLVTNQLNDKIELYYDSCEDLTLSYEKLNNYQRKKLALQQELWELFDNLPTLESESPELLTQSSTDFREKAEKFDNLQKEFNSLEKELAIIETKQINTKFTQGWANDLNATANIIDNLNQAINIESDSLLAETRQELQSVTGNFDQRIQDYEKGIKKQDKEIRDYYINQLDFLDKQEKIIHNMINDLKLKYSIKN